MASLTDPARELGEIAIRLTVGSNKPGSQFLAEQFSVDHWSTDFMRIITCIMERADLVAQIVSQSEAMDEDHKQSALNHIVQFKGAFIGASLQNHWSNAGNGLTIVKNHGGSFQLISQTVRPVVNYPKLTDEEVAELIELIDTYLADLSNSDEGPEFVRQAIKEGLTAFRFQLEKLGWMGSGYALSAFREVVAIYNMSFHEAAASDDQGFQAVVDGFLTIIRSFKSKVDEAKGWKDAADFVWAGYGLATKVAAPALLYTGVPLLSAG